MIYKGFLEHLVRVRDMDSENPRLESSPIDNEYPEVYPN